MFNDDPQTEAIVMIGEIGGNGEQIAAEWLKENCKKPTAAFIAGRTAPKGRIAVADTPSVIGETLLKHWGKM